MKPTQPPNSSALALWRLRDELTTDSRYSKKSVAKIVKAFAIDGEGRTVAACMIVSDGLSTEIFEAACAHIMKVIESDAIQDPLTLTLILESLQFIPVELLRLGMVQRFLDEASRDGSYSDIVSQILNRRKEP